MAELLPEALGWLDARKRALYGNIVSALNDPGGTLRSLMKDTAEKLSPQSGPMTPENIRAQLTPEAIMGSAAGQAGMMGGALKLVGGTAKLPANAATDLYRQLIDQSGYSKGEAYQKVVQRFGPPENWKSNKPIENWDLANQPTAGETITLKGIPEGPASVALPPPAEGMVRMFRGGKTGNFSQEVGREQQGRWFTSKPEDAAMYGDRSYIDVPQAVADASHKGGGAHVLPTEWAAKAVPELDPLSTPATPPLPGTPI